MAQAETAAQASNLYTGTGQANPLPPRSHIRGYSSVGHNIFAIDTDALKQSRETALKKKAQALKKRPMSAKIATANQPRFRNDGEPAQPGDIIHDYYADEFK